jgi:1-aminocyclopropane-1-carboxylate deaminase/D-cysteine desulfhydrase-like pyridoxal-dependent ACC family enzyme
MSNNGIVDAYVNEKTFLASFKQVLNLRGVRYLMSHENDLTYVDYGNNNGVSNLNNNYNFMVDIKDAYKKDIENKDFPESLKQDAKTQLAVIDDIEHKLTNAGYEPLSGGRRKRKRTKRRSYKRKRTKRRSNKRKQTKRKH